MALEIHEHEREGVVVLVLDGRLTAGDEVERLRDRVRAVCEGGQLRLVLDCAALHYIDSSGLGTLVHAHSTLVNKGGGLALLHLNERNIELMIITKLSTVFELFDDEREATNSFYPERRVRKFDILNFVTEQRKRKAKA
jgi:anti-sigma B factor antagonist